MNHKTLIKEIMDYFGLNEPVCTTEDCVKCNKRRQNKVFITDALSKQEKEKEDLINKIDTLVGMLGLNLHPDAIKGIKDEWKEYKEELEQLKEK